MISKQSDQRFYMDVHAGRNGGGHIMKPTKVNEEHAGQRLMVDIHGLTEMLSCGTVSAQKIADEAHAVLRIGHRKLYSVAKINKYIDDHTE